MYLKVLHSKLVNPDEKMDFLAFTRSITSHCLKAAKLRKELPPDIIYPRKRSWKGEAVAPANERKQGQHFAETWTKVFLITFTLSGAMTFCMDVFSTQKKIIFLKNEH